MQISIGVHYKKQKARTIKYKMFNRKITVWRMMSGHLTARRKGINVTGNNRSYKLFA
jgi:hypothetical protein